MGSNSLFGAFQRKLLFINALSRKTAIADSFPAWIGGVGANLEIDDSDVATIEFGTPSNTLPLVVLDSQSVLLNGQAVKNSELLPDQDYALLVKGKLVLLSWTRNEKKWLNSRSEDAWKIAARDGRLLAGPLSLGLLGNHVAQALAQDPNAIIHQLYSDTGFYLRKVAEILGWNTEEIDRKADGASVASSLPKVAISRATTPKIEEPISNINTDSGEFTCPACWIRFDRGDLLHIAAHASLKGDPILGEEEMLRFSATRFNNQGQALDAMSIPASEMACPHCRRRLPPSFLDLKQHIFSIVGAPSSGKSYFLSVLVKMLQNQLFTHFGLAFYDADPRENVRLTEMKNKLFSAGSAAEAMLAKTDLEGDMYLRVPRMGRTVLMPKPFVFNLAPQANPQDSVSIVFYDNAGEHFQPEADSVSSPGAQHVAAASGILFLFDPTYNLEFRKRLKGQGDPQLTDQRFDQQDTILAEMNARMKKLKSIDFRERVDTPVAVIVGKSDVWKDLVEKEAFSDPLWDTALDISVINRNSKRTRELLMQTVPAIVAGAEALSSKVRYFPVSAFGCSPEEVGIDKKTGRRMFSPDPNKINPQLVEIPMLWVLSEIEPALIKLRGVK